MARTLRWHPEIFQMMQEISGGYFTDSEEPVDPDIYEALVALNSLPFVRGTIYSCSGFGAVADLDMGKTMHLGEHAYVMLSYRMEDPRVAEFHDEMRKISAGSKPHRNKEFLAHPLGKTIVTYFAVPPVDMRAMKRMMNMQHGKWLKKVVDRSNENHAWIGRVKKLAEKYSD